MSMMSVSGLVSSGDTKPLDDYVYDLFVKRSLQKTTTNDDTSNRQVFAGQLTRLLKSGELVVSLVISV